METKKTFNGIKATNTQAIKITTAVISDVVKIPDAAGMASEKDSVVVDAIVSKWCH
ncbi:MAG: hypothetical protein Q8R15_02665 [Candidatus Micrarchaeota archaeon]|nr:hypothetical protein [Candidatus Micrarchaeota archaeon]